MQTTYRPNRAALRLRVFANVDAPAHVRAYKPPTRKGWALLAVFAVLNAAARPFNARVILSMNWSGAWAVKLLGTLKPWRRGKFSRGAGYINGFTLYAARGCKPHGPPHLRPVPFQIGATRNGNAAPYPSF